MQLLRMVKRFPFEKFRDCWKKDIHIVFRFQTFPYHFCRLQNGEGMKLWHKP